MKTIGLLGGISWESTAEYYRILNEEVQHRLGSHHSARIAMVSLDFHDVDVCVSKGRMDELSKLICSNAQRIEVAGADCLLICANTMHLLADDIQKAINIPVIHIAKVTRTAVEARGFQCVGLLGTKQTMELAFYKDILKEKGITVIIPDAKDRDFIQSVIFNDLFAGKLEDTSRTRFLEIIDGLCAQGAQGVILGCTELPLLVKQEHTPVPLFDTTAIHALAGLEFALKEE